LQVPETGQSNLVGMKIDVDVKGKGHSEPIIKSGKKVTASVLKELRKSNIKEVEVDTTQFDAAYALGDIVNMESGEVVLEANNEITRLNCRRLSKRAFKASASFPGTRRPRPRAFTDFEKDVVTAG
jgi:DNA-directed RNA polymerase subunit beta